MWPSYGTLKASPAESEITPGPKNEEAGEDDGEAAPGSGVGVGAGRSAAEGSGGDGKEQWAYLLWQCSRLLLLDLANLHGFCQVRDGRPTGG